MIVEAYRDKIVRLEGTLANLAADMRRIDRYIVKWDKKRHESYSESEKGSESENGSDGNEDEENNKHEESEASKADG